jgi:hypothetical protein
VDGRDDSADVVAEGVEVLVGVSLVLAGESVSSSPVAGAVVGPVSCAVDGAGVAVLGEVGVVSREDEALVSEPIVVPDDEEPPTRADTGCCPISSTPVTMAIASPKTAAA